MTDQTGRRVLDLPTKSQRAAPGPFAEQCQSAIAISATYLSVLWSPERGSIGAQRGPRAPSAVSSLGGSLDIS